MRLTNVLSQLNYHRHFKRVWKRTGKMEIKDLVISPELAAMGVEIKEGKDILNETKLFQPPVEPTGLPYPLPPSAFTPEVPYYKMHSAIKVTEGQNQVLALTKTVPYEGLPTEISSLINLDSLPNQDELVKINILQAHLWDAMQEKLPKRINPEKPAYVSKRIYGILNEKKVSGLLEKFSYLCDAATGKYADCFQRSKTLNAFSEIAVNRSGSNVAFQMNCDILLKAQKPLERFASLAEVKETENQDVPSIYPIKPTLDLDKCQNNPISNSGSETLYDPSFGHIHTLFVAQKFQESWLPNQQLAKAIATCFAFTAAEAHLKYGKNVGILPEPINVQCMYLDVSSANFLAYQLNTLEMEHNEGIKNMAWIDKPANFYSNVTDEDLITDYNPTIFPKMLAMYINGLRPDS